MLKPPSQNVPGMTDTLEFVKNLWGGMGVPGVGMSGMGSSSLGVPSMSTEDLDKRIADLKAVESWLNLNLSMLRTSIQALEVQRGTLAALKSMSDSMAQAMSKPGEQTASLPPFAAFFGANGAPGRYRRRGSPARGRCARARRGDAGCSCVVEHVAGPVPPGGEQRDARRRHGRQPGGPGRGAPDPAPRATTGGDVGGTPGTSAPKPGRTKADKP
ncbi:hypothetical protein G4G28_03140 [Massilia sp. Dwa41.01b]|uniref:PhaM family polyhydroxyalkanoate granule multifunctional regulatory protein n=1 Tax=Massilia sp. Dwa41.01b TaxID=2709302 RepID=UPI00160070F7|nr:PhaM family polyhydroxyalkanoate granule multifunctional regulatory protein [Massilia sp. Dwa41.01b]QNA87718.1 hypothetical protein G4G28_03140 [Massilia sp. Dwa41.01b]